LQDAHLSHYTYHARNNKGIDMHTDNLT